MVVFALMPDGSDGNLLFAQDSEERDVARLAEGDDQFTFERIIAHSSTGERVAFKDAEFLQDRVDSAEGKVEIPRLDCGRLKKLFQAPQVVLRFACEQDLVGHGAFEACFFLGVPIRD